MIWNIIAIVVISLSVLFSGMFASAETALFSLPWFRVISLREKSGRGRLVEKLRSNPQRLILDIIIGDFLLLVFVSVTLSSVIRNTIGEKYSLLYMFGFSILLVIIGELIPKGLAMRMPEEVSLFLSPTINAFSRFAMPLRAVLMRISEVVIPKGLFTEMEGAEIDLGRINDMVDVSVKQGFFDKAEGYLIGGLLRLKQTSVEQIMKRRGEVTLVSANDSLQKVRKVLAKEGYSRIPVYKNDTVNIVGYIHYIDIVSHIGDENKKIKEFIHIPLYIPENTCVYDLMEKMRSQRCHIAVIVNEYGEAVGIVTLEDIMNEFLRDVVVVQEREQINFIMLGLGQFFVDGSFPLSELENVIGVKIESDYSKTLGGYIMELTGRIPEIGEIIMIDGYEAVIIDADRMKIGRVVLRKR